MNWNLSSADSKGKNSFVSQDEEVRQLPIPGELQIPAEYIAEVRSRHAQ
jgi:hypothetical protein